MQLFVVITLLLASTRNAVAGAGCHLPEDSELISLITATYTSEVAISLTRAHYACQASGMYRDEYRSASLLVRYNCTTQTASCARGNQVEKELLDLRCVDGAWSVANFTEDTAAEFDTTPKKDCSSCTSSTERNTSLEYDATTHCVGKACSINNGEPDDRLVADISI